jgi:drug/metabolite transporter (DMT)-like permease
MHIAPSPARDATRMVLLTSTAMLMFAANSILCRLALAPEWIDPASFTSVRILSAATVLCAIVWLRHRRLPRSAYSNPRSITAVFIYFVFFSFAYTMLSAGTGALILIAGVQLTIFCIASLQGERFSFLSWIGFAVAIAGVLYLLLPGATAPDPLGAALMAISGAAWGVFTILARGAGNPEETNAANMLWCILPAALVNLLWLGELHVTATGLGLAIASGAIATGAGYVVWYLALRYLSSAQAATVQLSMPAVVALGGVFLLGEPLSVRLLMASAAMLGGIAVVLLQRPAR